MKGIDNHIIQLFKKYFAKNTNRLEMRQLEQEAEDNPYLSEAKEGVDKLSMVDRETTIQDLQSRLAKRIGKKESKIVPMQWLKLAAGVAILLSVGFFIWQPTNQNGSSLKEMASVEQTDVNNKSTSATKIQTNGNAAQSSRETIELTASDASGGDAVTTSDFVVPFPKEDIADANPFEIEGQQSGNAVIAAAKEGKPVSQAFNQGQEPESKNAANLPKTGISKMESMTEIIAVTDDIAAESDVMSESEVSEFEMDITEAEKAMTSAQSRSNTADQPAPVANAKAKAAEREMASRQAEDDLALDEISISSSAKRSEDDLASYPNAPVDGNSSFKKYIEANLVVPEAAKQNNISGKVILLFDVNAKGRPDNIEVKKSLGYGCDQEAIRLLQAGPDWVPGNRDGKTRLAVKFK